MFLVRWTTGCWVGKGAWMNFRQNFLRNSGSGARSNSWRKSQQNSGRGARWISSQSFRHILWQILRKILPQILPQILRSVCIYTGYGRGA